MIDTISLRPITAGDEPLLYRIYASTREEELRPLAWDDGRKEAFLRQQFAAQDQHYRQHFSQAAFQIVLLGETPAGRLYVDRRTDEIRIIDVALLPEFRGRGIGSLLLKELLEEAARESKPVRIHVEHENPAIRLYHRLGFHQVADTGVHYLMQWDPEGTRDPKR